VNVPSIAAPIPALLLFLLMYAGNRGINATLGAWPRRSPRTHPPPVGIDYIAATIEVLFPFVDKY
jgi:hypothetical protein